MEYKNHQIKVGKQEKLPNGKRKGVLDILDKSGNLVKIFLYTIGNSHGRDAAKLKAKKWIDENGTK